MSEPNTARAMGDAPRAIKLRHIGNCLKADPAYGKGVADALGIPLSEVPKSGETNPRPISGGPAGGGLRSSPERSHAVTLSKTMQDALNDQIQKEYYSSYLYLAMSAQLEAQNLPGAAKWTRLQSQEELTHALKLFDHVVGRGGRVTLAAIEQPPKEYGSALQLFEKVLAHEQLVTASIHKLYAAASKDQDYPAQIMLQWFVTEQVEEEKNATQVVEQLKAVGESKTSLMLLDRHLGKRGA